MIEEKYYLLAEVQAILRIKNIRTLYKWINEKRIGVTRFGRREMRVSESQLQAFLRVENVGKKKGSIWTTE